MSDLKTYNTRRNSKALVPYTPRVVTPQYVSPPFAHIKTLEGYPVDRRYIQ